MLSLQQPQGPNLSGNDPESGEMQRLFHPRDDSWNTHFRWRGAVLAGKTPVGRTTITVLNINRPDAVMLRRVLLAGGVRF